MKSRVQIVAIFLASIFCAGCATGPAGPRYSRIEVPSEKSVLYVYLDKSVPYYKYDIAVNGQPIGRLAKKSYIQYQATPGPIKVAVTGSWPSSVNNAPIPVNMESGKPAFVRCTTTTKVIAGSPMLGIAKEVGTLEWVRNETGEADIARCRLMK